MSVQLDNSYGVVCHRGKDDQWVRALYLEAVASEPGTFRLFAIYFIEKDDPSLGQGYVNPDNGYVVPVLPARDFDALYHLLQTEKKVYANWSAGGDNTLEWFQIGASKDPLPKGPTAVPLLRCT